MARITRRAALAGAALVPFSALGAAGAEEVAEPKLRVLIAGGHPGDPEAGCGRTMALVARAGHDVAVLYLTRGEAGVSGKSHEQAGIRSAEAARACEILKARPMFA